MDVAKQVLDNIKKIFEYVIQIFKDIFSIKDEETEA